MFFENATEISFQFQCTHTFQALICSSLRKNVCKRAENVSPDEKQSLTRKCSVQYLLKQTSSVPRPRVFSLSLYLRIKFNLIMSNDNKINNPMNNCRASGTYSALSLGSASRLIIHTVLVLSSSPLKVRV